MKNILSEYHFDSIKQFLRKMRTTSLMLIVSISSLFATNVKSQITKVSFTVQNASILNVIEKIESQTDYLFVYNKNEIDLNRKVNISATNQPVAEILSDIFNNTNIVYAKEGTNIMLMQKSVSQQQKITGTVTDKSGTPLPGVNVVVTGTTQGTLTDIAGKYSIDLPQGAKSLTFSFIGMESQEISIGTSTLVNVTMAESAIGLEEVVVVAYGTQQKRDITGSISQLNTAKIRDIPVSNIGQQLQGKFAGVQIDQSTGEPGHDMTFRIRGAASINAGNSPLIVVDGFPTIGGFSTINPDEIESITVLKDASATSLYGSRASNGVILVTTKQAKSGQTNVEFSSYVGIEVVGDRGKPDVMNAQEFAQFKKEYYEDAAKYEGYTGGVPAIYQNPEQYAGYVGTNWVDVLLRKAMTQNYNLSLSSGTKDLKSVVILNYNKQDGVIINSYSERFTGRSNNIYTVSDKLTLGLNLAFSYERRQVDPALSNTRGIIELAYLMDPILKYKNDDGTYPISFLQPGMFPMPNLYLVATQRQNPVKTTTILANTFAEYKIIKGLQYRISLNVEGNNMITRTWYPSTTMGSTPPNPPYGSYGTSGYLSWLVENTLTYQKTINEKHNFDALIGYSAQNYYSEGSNIVGDQFPDDNIGWINVATSRIGTASSSESSLLSYIGRLNYNYDSKYLISLAFRNDGSSKFGANTKWGNFPSFSIGWVVSNENFMKNINKGNLLKIRASYGKTGNFNIGNYTYLASVTTNNYVFNDNITAGKALSSIGNADLTWETTSGYDVGLDLELFKGRISFTYDYYWKKTEGLLYAIDIPIESGFSSINSNIGRFDFWGHEFSISSKNFIGKFNWNTDFNISFDRNIVKKLGTNNTPIGGYDIQWDDNRTAVGHPIGMFYGFVNTGVYMTQEEFDTQPHMAGMVVGTTRFKDVSGPNGVPDGIITLDDRTFIGDPNPDFIFGITNKFSYKNFDLSITMAGTVGNDISNDAFESTENIDGVFNVRKLVADRWRSLDDPGAGIIPRTLSGTTGLCRIMSTLQIFKGSYLAAKNITIGYTLPLPPNKYIKKASVDFSVQNPFMLTTYPGMNPEVSIFGLNGLNQGRDWASYPISKIFTLGARINF